MLLNSKNLPQIVEDSLSRCRNENETKLRQKVHNDSHIFCLKTASNSNFDKQVFNLNFQQSKDKKSPSRIKIKSKKELQHSLNLKQSSSRSLSLMSSSTLRYTQCKDMADDYVQRQSKRIELKDALQSNIMANMISQEKNKYSVFLVQRPKENRKKNMTQKQKRNYFNVSEFIQNQELRKNKNAAVMMRGNMNSALKWIKQQSLEKQKEKPSKISSKIKSLQFNAIEITKKIVDKNAFHIDRSLFQRSNLFLRPSRSLKEHGRLKDHRISHLLQSVKQDKNNSNNVDFSQQKASLLWRSSSHQLQKKSKFFEVSEQVKKDYRKKKNVRTQRNDNQMDLKAWNQEDNYQIAQLNTRYTCLKTQRMDIKRKDDQNEFINYSIRTSRHQRGSGN